MVAALFAGHSVRALVRPSSPRPPTWLNQSGLTVVEGSLDDPKSPPRLMEGCDALVHLAAMGVQNRQRQFQTMLESNALLLPAWLASAKLNVKLVVSGGTCLEYRGQGTLPPVYCEADAPAHLLEEETLVEPLDPYGWTKWIGGLLQRRWAHQAALPLWYLRFASLIGPEDDSEKLIPSAVKAAAKHQSLSLTGGEQVREWLDVTDAARSILHALDRQPPGGVELVNVGTGVGVRLRDLVSELFRIAHADGALIHFGDRPYREGDPHHLVMDPSRSRRWLEWEPAQTLEQTIKSLFL